MTSTWPGPSTSGLVRRALSGRRGREWRAPNRSPGDRSRPPPNGLGKGASSQPRSPRARRATRIRAPLEKKLLRFFVVTTWLFFLRRLREGADRNICESKLIFKRIFNRRLTFPAAGFFD